MASVCDVCGKSPIFGMSVSRLGGNALHRRIKARTKRRWNPNIQRVRAMVNGSVRRINVCTSCIKGGKIEKAGRPTSAA